MISISRQTYDHMMDIIGQQEWLSILSVINQKFVFDIKKDAKIKETDSKTNSSLQKACSNLELGLGPSSFSFIKTLKITNNSSILCMSVTPDNRTLLAGSSDSAIYKWDLSGHESNQVPQSAAKSTPNAPHPTPDVELFYDERFRVENGESSKLYVELRGHSGPVYRIDIHRTEQIALSASHDATVILWCLQSNSKYCYFIGRSHFLY